MSMPTVLRDSAPGTDDLIPSAAAAEAELIERAEGNMERARQTFHSGGFPQSANMQLQIAMTQATIANAKATARLADATEALARSTRRTA